MRNMQFDDGGYFHIVKGYSKEELQEDKKRANDMYNIMLKLLQSYHKNPIVCETFDKNIKTF